MKEKAGAGLPHSKRETQVLEGVGLKTPYRPSIAPTHQKARCFKSRFGKNPQASTEYPLVAS